MAKYIKSEVTEERVDPFTGEILCTTIEKTIAIKTTEDFVMAFSGSILKTRELSEAGFKTLNYIVLNAGYAGDPPIGNIFNFNAVVAEHMSTKMNISTYAIKKSLKQLVALELLIKDKKVRGVYYVNPLYFWKGKLSDRLKSVEISTRYILE